MSQKAAQNQPIEIMRDADWMLTIDQSNIEVFEYLAHKVAFSGFLGRLIERRRLNKMGTMLEVYDLYPTELDEAAAIQTRPPSIMSLAIDVIERERAGLIMVPEE